MLRGAIVGFGNVAQFGHWPAYENNREVDIVAVVDLDPERRGVAQDLSLQTCETISQLRDLAIDFVDICTPPAHHADEILECAANGWHVLCEKPLVTDSRRLQEITAASVAIVPVHNWKYAPIIRRATELLKSGTIGELREVEVTVLRTQPAASAERDWRGDAKLAGGGILMDHGWHAIYLARHWFGEDPVEVEATLHRAAPNGIEDEATLKLRFPKGRATIFLTWRAEARRNTMRLQGERGQIAIDDDTLKIAGEEVRFESALSAGSHHADWFETMLPDVIKSFRAPESARKSFEEAALCLSVIRRAYQVASAV
jgi:predicted dehydrogenase